MFGEESLRKGFGRTDTTSLVAIRDVFLKEEPLLEDWRFDDPINPRKLILEMGDGVHDNGEFTIRWSEKGYYSIHYSEGGQFNFRFDYHENPHSSSKHFHPPPDTTQTDAKQSCIDVDQDELVARAMRKVWRYWIENESISIEELPRPSDPSGGLP